MMKPRRVFPELDDSEASLSEIADFLVLLDRVVGAQSFEYAVEMCGFAALSVGDGGCKIPNRFLTQRAQGKVDLRFGASPIPPMSGSGFVVLAHAS